MELDDKDVIIVEVRLGNGGREEDFEDRNKGSDGRGKETKKQLEDIVEVRNSKSGMC